MKGKSTSFTFIDIKSIFIKYFIVKIVLDPISSCNIFKTVVYFAIDDYTSI